jgi:sterol desaturase/sphingolipid hydroxylase (fatty acid hydroxylase superfamily)
MSDFLSHTFHASIGLGTNYTLFAGIAWLLGYVIFKRSWFHRKIIARFPRWSDVGREIGYSVLSLFIFAAVGVLTIFLIHKGWTRLYMHSRHHGWAWIWLSAGLVILLHDAYFYWTHRLMHHPRLFPYFHRVHHLSHNPTPWSAYAFHPLEAVVQASIFPLSLILVPMHPLAFGIFMVWQLVFNVLGHTGYEYSPKGFMDSWLKYLFNTPTNHIMHHEKMKGNYGLYFGFWDRIMRTNHSDYENRFREVTSRRVQGGG